MTSVSGNLEGRRNRLRNRFDGRAKASLCSLLKVTYSSLKVGQRMRDFLFLKQNGERIELENLCLFCSCYFPGT